MNQSISKQNIERWLTQGNYKFKEIASTEYNFHIQIKQLDGPSILYEIFQPFSQTNVLVCGAKVVMKNSQIHRYRKLNDQERKKFENKVTMYCNSIKAVHRFLDEDGKKKIGVYIVFDDKFELNHGSFLKAITDLTEMHEKTSQFISKTF